MKEQRIVPLQRIHNFRDYGGYRTRNGAMLRTGILFRSGQHVEATSEDLSIVSQLNLATVVDLRGDSERLAYPCKRASDFSATVLFAPGETAGKGNNAPHLEAAERIRTSLEAHDAMARLYASMPFRPILSAALRLYFDALTDREGASLIHCVAGKDRTGVAVALPQRLLGVHEDDVLADYMLTNTVANIERRIASGAHVIRRNFGAQIEDDAIRTLMSVHPEYLGRAFGAMIAEYGSVESYARNVLGLTSANTDRIEKAVLE